MTLLLKRQVIMQRSLGAKHRIAPNPPLAFCFELAKPSSRDVRGRIWGPGFFPPPPHLNSLGLLILLLMAGGKDQFIIFNFVEVKHLLHFNV